MRFVPVTLTAVEKLRRLAKKTRDERGIKLAEAYDLVAKSNGFENWKHVTECLERTIAARGTTGRSSDQD